jgi:hypothetical protein
MPVWRGPFRLLAEQGELTAGHARPHRGESFVCDERR